MKASATSWIEATSSAERNLGMCSTDVFCASLTGIVAPWASALSCAAAPSVFSASWKLSRWTTTVCASAAAATSAAAAGAAAAAAACSCSHRAC